MTSDQKKRRLAIIGCGSSGLVTLKFAIEQLPDWEIIAFESSGSITGCWGDPYLGFVSTSTKYTTQFACYPKWLADVRPDAGASRNEFFRDGEYGVYLECFAKDFGLREHILLHHRVQRIEQLESNNSVPGKWLLTVNGQQLEPFDALVLCTGLTAIPKSIKSSVPQPTPAELNQALANDEIKNQTIVVMGGGESAVDYANRLALGHLNNQVYLSLRSGIRVSPRYHPVCGVPSDFLRNRLMLSADPDFRNLLGEVFVLTRIKYQRWVERLFPGNQNLCRSGSDEVTQRTKQWTLRLTQTAKDGVFNVFHNKSDDFLAAVGEQRIQIVGPPQDERCCEFVEFEPLMAPREASIRVDPQMIIPAIGFQSKFPDTSQSPIHLSDFYMGCCHVDLGHLYAVGFARPIIGNVPSISEMQARYVIGLIAGRFKLPSSMKQIHADERANLRSRYQNLDTSSVYPVEMFPYCDRIAQLIGRNVGPGWWRHPIRWLRTRLSPATTMHYFSDDKKLAPFWASSPVYLPTVLIGLILALKPLGWLFRVLKPRFTRRPDR